MDWSKGYSTIYYMKRVDPATWRDTDTIRITGGTITRESSGLRESADIKCVNFDVAVEDWVRVYMDTRQDGDSDHVALFTGLATSPDGTVDGTRWENKLACFSVLKPADDVYLKRGWYVAAGMRGAEVIEKLLVATPAPVEVVGESPRLATSIIAEDNETNLSMAEKILTAIGWRMRITGDGRIVLSEKAAEPSATFNPLEYDVIEPQIDISTDWYSCPNVFMAVDGDMTGIARDDSEKSPLSTVNRGREVWMVETNSDFAANETIAEYAQRRLSEEQRTQRTASYDRRFMPNILPSDIVMMHYPAQDLEGQFLVETQSIELGYAARTSETISTVVTSDSLIEKVRETKFVYLIDDETAHIVTDDGDRIIALTEV